MSRFATQKSSLKVDGRRSGERDHQVGQVAAHGELKAHYLRLIIGRNARSLPHLRAGVTALFVKQKKLETADFQEVGCVT